mmetsp:Transcript_12244/g.28564  ORF Transcript_12244/g.28564 Transcript_12244/m.28564 type:complete len:293 (+) Transcript_12244:428-1306(+)
MLQLQTIHLQGGPDHFLIVFQGLADVVQSNAALFQGQRSQLNISLELLSSKLQCPSTAPFDCRFHNLAVTLELLGCMLQCISIRLHSCHDDFAVLLQLLCCKLQSPSIDADCSQDYVLVSAQLSGSKLKSPPAALLNCEENHPTIALDLVWCGLKILSIGLNHRLNEVRLTPSNLRHILCSPAKDHFLVRLDELDSFLYHLHVGGNAKPVCLATLPNVKGCFLKLTELCPQLARRAPPLVLEAHSSPGSQPTASLGELHELPLTSSSLLCPLQGSSAVLQTICHCLLGLPQF